MYWKNIFGYSIRSLFSLSSAYNFSCMGMHFKFHRHAVVFPDDPEANKQTFLVSVGEKAFSRFKKTKRKGRLFLLTWEKGRGIVVFIQYVVWKFNFLKTNILSLS